jgi:ribosomal protein S18 acetylase RimI-like enzyme
MLVERLGDRRGNRAAQDPKCFAVKNLSAHSHKMIAIEPITPENVIAFKETRLRALQDTPSAFGSTYEKEIRLTDAEWNNRALRWRGEAGIGFLAFDNGAACGIAGSFLDQNDPSCAQLISMWTAPSHRGRGVGRMLVDEVAAWAHRRGATILQLLVTSNNDGAMRFYERLGFTPTGRTAPYPNDPKLVEYEMERRLP